jgi:hypothetical protein
MDTINLDTFVRLPKALFWNLYGYRFYRLLPSTEQTQPSNGMAFISKCLTRTQVNTESRGISSSKFLPTLKGLV